MDTKQEPTFDEDLSTIVSQLPPPVRAFFSSGKVETVAKNLTQKNQLHIDQGAIVEREIILLLLGLKNPDEFSKALAEEAKLEQKTINGIVEDINAQIFIPLRKEMRSGAETKQEPAEPAVPQSQQPPKPVAPQASPQSAATQPPRPDWGSHASARAPSQPTTAIPTPPVPANVKPPQVLVPPPPVSQRPALRDVLATVMKAPGGKQASPEPRKFLEDHEEPHIEFKNKAPATVPVASSVASVPPKPAASKAPPPKPYSVDPYREPIDEK